MEQRNNQVFQLSLTEIAFTIIFILLLLLGYLVFKEQQDRVAAEKRLAGIQTLEQATSAMKNAKSALTIALSGVGVPNPDEIISKLIDEQSIKAERDALKKRVEDLDAKLTALTELQEAVGKVTDKQGQEVVKGQMESALALQSKLKKAMEQAKSASAPASSSLIEEATRAVVINAELRTQLKEQLTKDLPAGQESKVIRDLVASAKSHQVLKKENSDLRGQVAFLNGRLNARGGSDYPPCWADKSTGRVQTLFFVEVKSDIMVVKANWPPVREAQARTLPGIEELLANSPHTYADFNRRVQGIFHLSQKESCRHYVVLKSSIANAVESDRARLMVENFFYKIEVRR